MRDTVPRLVYLRNKAVGITPLAPILNRNMKRGQWRLSNSTFHQQIIFIHFVWYSESTVIYFIH